MASKRTTPLGNLFGVYELLAKSGLFDAAYYLRANPDIARQNVDPLAHYLEHGAVELRNPSAEFDARHYARQCRERGERFENPLLHYLESGAAQGLTPRFQDSPESAPNSSSNGKSVEAQLTSAAPQDLLLTLDRMVLKLDHGSSRLTGSGWCLAASPIAELRVALGDVEVRARYGLQRPDVARVFGHYLKADQSGFEFILDQVPDEPSGVVDLVFAARTEAGATLKKSEAVDLAVLRARAPEPADTLPAPDSPQINSGRPPMQLYVDSAEVDDTGILHIVGWAVCLVPIISTQVFIDDEKLATAEYGKAREDVAASHTDYPNARYSGFALHTDIGSYPAGDRVIKVQATAMTGICREVLLPFTLSGERRACVPDRDRSKIDLFCDLIELTTGGYLNVKGWSVGATATERLSVLLDGNEIGDAEIGIERPDVANQFPTLAHARRAGFSFRHRVPAVSVGEHLITLRHRMGSEEADILLPVPALTASPIEAQPDTLPVAGNEDLLLSIDLPKLADGSVVAPVRGNLEIAGWALARQGVASVDIAIDDARIKSAHTGVRRLDVQRAHPDWDGALTAGFSALLPHRSLPKGSHVVSIALRDRKGQIARAEFRIQVEDAPDTDGPWSLRHRMSPTEIDLLDRSLPGNSQRPSFAVVLPLPRGTKELQQARVTLASLATQVYENWHLYFLTPTHPPASARRALLDGFDELVERVILLSGAHAAGRLLAARGAATYLAVLRPGDELGCDALLEFAVHATEHPEADFLYCDERRLSPASGKVEAFFKPQWSPDLLLSMNYLGRAWCARADTFRRAAITPNQLGKIDAYDLALRLTEQATSIRHVPVTLLQATDVAAQEESVDRDALEGALKRRGIAGSVDAGRAHGTYRVRRKLRTKGLVSVIIATCAARGLIRKCIETLRGLTAYRNVEIVCIENIPDDKPDWKAWVRANTDTVTETAESFNWSRYNNLATASARGEYLLFLNDDIEIIDRRWLHTLLEQAERPEVGAVGPQLLYPDGRVQHAGMFLASLGVARHAFRNSAEDEPGYFGLALAQRDVIAVTGACLLTRRETFESLGRFDESHDVVNNDIDYCLRVWKSGLRTIYTPHTKLIHHELASRSGIADSYGTEAFASKWRSIFTAGDPFFHIHLTKDRDDYSNEWEPVETLCAAHPVFPRESIRRILIVKLDHIGDCVTALPAVRRLKQHFPTAKLVVLTGRASKAVWALEPAIDELIEFDFFNARSSSGVVERTEDDWRDLRQRLALHRFDLAIDLRKHWETRTVLRHAGARYLAGFDMKGRFPWLDVAIEWSEDVALIRKRQHTTDDLVNLVDAVAASGEPHGQIGIPTPRALSAAARRRIPMVQHIFDKRVVCVHPSAGNEMKQWPPEYFRVLIDQLVESGDLHVILIGTPDESELGASILKDVANPPSVWSLIGRVALDDLPALIARCSLFVGNDSGPKHIAAALGIPTVGIHSGVVDAREWGPRGANAIAIHRAMTCAPCYLLRPEDCDRGLACLRSLLPEHVVAACRRLLAAAAGRSSRQEIKA
jgi:ADP-heptose:LPS heptosyltransferase/GT2 family glycosyltransferase